jgi:uncharacterized protein
MTDYEFRWGEAVVRYHVMCKPIASACNLACTYCYYLSKKGLLEQAGDARISDDILEAYIRQNVEGQTGAEEVVFSWQGGEPTLLGLDFFKKVVALERKYARGDVRLENDLQTNGVLLDAAWCRFLKEHDFLVGLSVDGPRHFHDKHRVDREGKGSFERVVKAARLLREHGVRFNTLTCVSRDNARDPLAVYRFLRDRLGSVAMQFIPVVEPEGFERTAPQHWPADEMPVLGTAAALPGTPDSFVTDWSVDPEDWGTFLKAIFDEWYRRDVGRTWVDLFESAVYTASGRYSPLCTLAPLCGKCLALEADGSLYSCDHYVYPEYRLGNILDKPIVDLAFSERQRAFANGKQALTRLCRSCKFLTWCYGECCKNRFLRTPEGEAGHNYLCVGYRKFFNHVEGRVRELASQIAAGR